MRLYCALQMKDVWFILHYKTLKNIQFYNKNLQKVLLLKVFYII